MEHYSKTGVLKSGEINISKSCMALLLTSNQPFSAFTTEKITVYIERAKGTNTEIVTNGVVKDIALLSMHGVSAIIQKAGTTSLLIFLANGSLVLGENETIKVVLDSLKSTVTYTVNSMESPIGVQEPFRYERKTVTTDETVRDFEVSGFELAVIDGFSAVTEVFMTFANGVTSKYLPSEIIAMAEFADPVYLIADGVSSASPAGGVVLELMDVVSIQVQKNVTGPVNITLKR